MTKLRNSYPEDIACVLCFPRVFQRTKNMFYIRKVFVLPVFRVETSGWFNSATSAFRVNLFQLFKKYFHWYLTSQRFFTQEKCSCKNLICSFLMTDNDWSSCPRGLLGISSHGDDRRIFVGLKFLISGFVGYENLASTFWGSLIWVGIFGGIIENW